MTHITRRNALHLAAAAVALPLVATVARADGHATTHTVTIKDFGFNPSDLQIKAGDTVTWTNEDNTRHTATDLNEAFDTPLIAPGQSVSITFNGAGTFNYKCKPHPRMRGTITSS